VHLRAAPDEVTATVLVERDDRTLLRLDVEEARALAQALMRAVVVVDGTVHLPDDPEDP